MKTTMVMIPIDKVSKFVHITEQIPGDIDIGRITIARDAKSIMGILSMDLSGPLELHFHEDDADISLLEEFLWKE